MKVEVTIPNSGKVFSTKISVRISDINYGGHMGNDSVLSLCHEARVQFFSSLGMSEKDFFGQGIIMNDAAIMYKAEAFQGDKLEIDLFIDDIHKCGLDFLYRIVRRDKVEYKVVVQEIARVKTGIIFFNYEKRKIARCPDGFLKRFVQKD